MGKASAYKKKEKDTEASESQAGDGFGLNQANFKQVAPSGFGDPLNAYPHAMAWFNGCLYVGTTRANLHLLDVGNKALPGLVGDIVWPVRLPENIWDLDLRAQIWRYNPRTSEWKKVFVAPMVKGIDGFDVPMCIGFRVMTVFQGKSDKAPALYVNTWANSQRPETALVRSSDGANFELVSEAGMGLGEPVPRTLRALIPFKGRIYTAPAMGAERGKPNTAARAVVLVSDDPAAGSWDVACEPNFGDRNNISLLQMEVFNDHLYASTMNVVEGFQVWKTDGEGELPLRWTKVVSHGAYRGRLNQMALSMRAFGDHIYVGSAIQTGGFDRLNNIGPDAPELVRIAADDSWDLLVGEARATPDGLKVPLSGMGPGFGNIFSGYFWQMCEHDGWLYLSNSVWSTFFMFVNQEKRRKNGLENFDTRQFEDYLKSSGGFNLWRSKNGVKWMPVTMNGFGNHFNIGVRNMVSTPYGLFAGVANSFGPEVAVKRLAKWTYESNKGCGLEIWLGNHNKEETLCPQQESSVGSSAVRTVARQFFSKYSPEAMVDEYYAGSGFRCSGLWREGIRDIKTACENLMDEVVAFLPNKKGTVLDVSCGLGATTGHLLGSFKPEDVTGVTADKDALERCRSNAPGVNFLRMKLPGLKLPGPGFDNVICIEGMGRFKRREDMLASIYGVLRKGGTFVFTDLIYEGSETEGSAGVFRRDKRELLVDAEAYEDALTKIGFSNVHIEDVTEHCWESFARDAQMYFMSKLIAHLDQGSRGAYEEAVQEAFDLVMNKGAAVSKYLLISATR